MLLPALDPITLEPNGVLSDHSMYFNPSLNPYYHHTEDGSYHPDANSQRMSLSLMTKISNAVLKNHGDINLLMKSIKPTWSINSGPLWEVIFREYIDALPEEHKYLAFSTIFSAVANELNTRTYRFRGTIYTLRAIEDSESKRTTKIFDFSVNYDPRTIPEVSFTEDQKAAFRTSLATVLPDAIAGFNERMGARVWFNDIIVPKVVQLMYKYATNQPCFYPGRGREHYANMPHEWLTPWNIKVFQNINTNMTLSMHESWERISYNEIVAQNDRRLLGRIQSYNANVLEYLPYTIKGPKEPGATLYGVELEACSDYPGPDVINAQKDLFFFLKADSSIHGSKPNAYEMVTVPCSLKAHKRLWAEFFSTIDYTKFDTSKKTGNGMHVHIDRETFKKGDHLNKFIWFFINPINRDFLFLISERENMSDLIRWAKFGEIRTNNSLIWNARRARDIQGDLRGAVNLRKSKTVEVRIFKGLVSYATIVKNIEFVDSVVEYTRETQLSQLSLSGYLSWLSNTPKNKYEMLKTFLQETKVQDYQTIAELDTYTYGMVDEEAIAEKLNKAPFEVTQFHVTTLNKRRKKRIFTFKKGVVECVTKGANKGVLAKLDLIAQQKQTRGASSFALTNI